MSNTFELAVRKLKDAAPEDVVQQLSELFRNITQFDTTEVTVAYQTLKVLESTNSNLAFRAQSAVFKEALELQMLALTQEARENGEAGAWLRICSKFRMLTGNTTF